jgi:hypothetical protein
MSPGKPSPLKKGPKGVISAPKVELPPGVKPKMVDFAFPPGLVAKG